MSVAAAPGISPEFITELLKILPRERVITDADELFVYESDGFTIAKSNPGAVVFPMTTDEVVRVVQLLNKIDVQIIPRGTGTGLTGGCTAYANGAVISLVRMNKVLKIDFDTASGHMLSFEMATKDGSSMRNEFSNVRVNQKIDRRVFDYDLTGYEVTDGKD